ncbi:MAG TPA: polysaccharide deacetylase family protein [Pseudonocardiaceae bacterium]|nr:polysaccharide deacetylase family protein [Pseudonocardiaceae bacterium]
MNPGVTQPRHLMPAGLRLVVFGLVVVAMVGLTVAVLRNSAREPIRESPPAAPLTGPARLAGLAAPPGAPGPGGDPARRILVLYHEAGPNALLSRQYAVQAANLASRGGTWEMRPIDQYRPGDLGSYQAMIHIAVGPDPLPPYLLADIADSAVPVLWLGSGIDQFFAADPTLARRLGWSVEGYGPDKVTGVEYAGRLLKRRAEGDQEVARIRVDNPAAAKVLGLARRADGTTMPWAVRAENLTYVGEVAFAYAEPGDRYLAAADLLLQTVAPEAPQRRRALVRIEDVGPNSNPNDIRAVADLLSQRRIPFTLAVYPLYRDPHGASNRGRSTAYRLVDKPELVDALKYAREHGATILMHGYSHQYEDLRNPYTGTSAEDYEFYEAHLDPQNNVRLEGPVPADSQAWAAQRLSTGRGEFARVGLPDPDIFEFPHYTASENAYRAVHDMFGVRYDQGSYFDGMCARGNCADASGPPGEMFQQFFPYPVRDVYGSVVVPENLASITQAFNNNPARTVEDVIANAEAMTVVRDGVASTFYHPYLGVEMLSRVVDGIRELGYEFVSPYDVLEVPER